MNHSENQPASSPLSVTAGFGVPSFEEMERQDIAERPYEVFHPWAETMGPKFKTWPEARSAAKDWNRECPGHVARKRRFFPSPNEKAQPLRAAGAGDSTKGKS